jgi:hypothetical protein
MFDVYNLRPCPTAMLRPSVNVTARGADGEYDVVSIYAVKIDIVPRRRGQYLLIYLVKMIKFMMFGANGMKYVLWHYMKF